MMTDKIRKLKLKKLDVLYLVHNPLDCLIVYFCVCFTFIRIIYDIFHDAAAVTNTYIIALVFTVVMGCVMTLWAKRAFKDLDLQNIL